MSKLTANMRHNLPSSAFALPKERGFPIENISHARNALARASGTSVEGKVRAAVEAKYPSLKK